MKRFWIRHARLFGSQHPFSFGLLGTHDFTAFSKTEGIDLMSGVPVHHGAPTVISTLLTTPACCGFGYMFGIIGGRGYYLRRDKWTLRLDSACWESYNMYTFVVKFYA
ncbi:hypothetical protein BU23DRAFT_3171 [Bimuria novae-zelandiae CBS 107.79]|uniref:Uncharacterized protein n=1 Tax=Bimuria novae-zelandiae CBS 107.79 TaxID=1447943 RepID=A0A6A5VU96_9PLEO|nr:hypothetical protein BU23DRAFT_3171 [Bimuria novae-zelandiae CBS 107.79]